MTQPIRLRPGMGRPARNHADLVRIEVNVPAELWLAFHHYAERERRTMGRQLQVVLEATLAADRAAREVT